MKKICLLLVTVFLFFISFANAAYTSEEMSAYTWAFNNGITTQTTIDNANMYGEISRIELAKGLVIMLCIIQENKNLL